MNPEDFRPGIYRHYKGPVYLALGLAHDANADEARGAYSLFQLMEGGLESTGDFEPLGERVAVTYIGLQLDGAHTGPRLAVRTLDDFVAVVDYRGRVCTHVGVGSTYCGECDMPVMQRFTYVGQSWEGQ